MRGVLAPLAPPVFVDLEATPPPNGNCSGSTVSDRLRIPLLWLRQLLAAIRKPYVLPEHKRAAPVPQAAANLCLDRRNARTNGTENPPPMRERGGFRCVICTRASWARYHLVFCLPGYPQRFQYGCRQCRRELTSTPGGQAATPRAARRCRWSRPSPPEKTALKERCKSTLAEPCHVNE